MFTVHIREKWKIQMLPIGEKYFLKQASPTQFNSNEERLEIFNIWNLLHYDLFKLFMSKIAIISLISYMRDARRVISGYNFIDCWDVMACDEGRQEDVRLEFQISHKEKKRRNFT